MKAWLKTVLLAAFALGACAAPIAQISDTPDARLEAKTIYVTRHMQKAQGDDPPLSSEGAAAAERLGDLLADRGIAAIFATPTRRAMETAAPLSQRSGVDITAYDPRNPQALAALVAAAQGSVLVVGHSNTVHDLIGHFGGEPPQPLTEEDYGTVFVIDSQGEVGKFNLD